MRHSIKEHITSAHGYVLSYLYLVEDISLRNLYYESAHQKKDLIYRCSFGGETCSAKNFTTQLTDFGTCYTFNGDTLKSREISEEGRIADTIS